MDFKHIEHIPAGRIKYGKTGQNVYQAYLGTCVGVALYDDTANVGGLIHILLPEPPSSSPADFPEKYASTGLPRLIRNLINIGASCENLKAGIAGGALIGPVNRQDINLDIGGRSADIAISILENAGIEIVQSETGGFFACTLELDMSVGRFFIRPAWDYIAKSKKADLNSHPSPDDIKDTIEHLKPIPQTALKILRMFHSGRYGISEITRELAKDQVLSAQTLKLCNSALFSGIISVETLKDAVLLLGEKMLIKSVITAAVNTYFSQTGTSGYSLCRGGLFFHAVSVASAAEKIAALSKKSDPGTAYTAGLLHDIGKVILDQYIADSAPLFFRQLSLEHGDSQSAEKEILGITHNEAGGLLAEKWNLPEGISHVIRYHHAPQKKKEHKDLVYIVYLADLLMEKFNTGLDFDKIQTDSFENVINHLKITAQDLFSLIDTIPFHDINTDDFLTGKR
jgi:putative nucleotidyltransferase with HDIG domain